MKNYREGFTLMELLVVIVIIGIMSAFLVSNFVGVRQRGRDTLRKSDLRQIQSALEFYRSDQGEYPLTAGFPACGSSLQNPPANDVTYIKKIPCDPSTNTAYTYFSDSLTYSIIACLENGLDPQKDPANIVPCDGTTNFSYTLQNP